MSANDLTHAFLERGCFPHQAEFAAKFLAPESPKKHVLVSAPGLGKHFAAATICSHAHATGQAKRILVLTPPTLVGQWYDVIRRGTSDVFVLIVDRRNFREMEADAAETPWPATGIVIMSVDFAKQADIGEGLAQTKWDLVVIDEAPNVSLPSQRHILVAGLVESSPDMRVLFLRTAGPVSTPEINPNSDRLLCEATTTVWSRESLRDEDGKALLPKVHIEWIFYTRQPDEVKVLSVLQDLLRPMQASSPGIAKMVMQVASSSLFALEQRLNRMRLRRNELIYGKNILVEDDDDLEDVASEDSTAISSEADTSVQSEFVDTANRVLQMLDDVETDSKFDKVLELLTSLGLMTSSDRRVCIFTRYVDTATYLESALSEHHPEVATLTASLSLSDRAQIVAQFTQTGGILIVAEKMSLQIPEVAAVIFYDLPLNPAVLDARIGQFIRIGRPPVHLFAFMDESDALIFEKLRRKLTEIKDFDVGDFERLLGANFQKLLREALG
jgi:superfamily II DNA or RNA helicase